MSAFAYLIIILLILVLSYLLETIADWLDLKQQTPELPQEFVGHYDGETYAKSQRYNRERTMFGILKDTISLPITIVFILVSGFDHLDKFARGFGQSEIVTGLIFFGLLSLATTLLGLPFSIYSTFVIEEKYGFNRTTVKTFILDLFKGLLITVILGGAVLYGIIWLFGAGGENAWLYAWLSILALMLLLQYIAPVVFMPLFNKFTPLEEGELKTEIEKYAQKEQFKMQGIFTMDGSKRSSKSNAFFTGFGRFRRIALFDTLIAQLSVSELVAVLAHEIGHYKKKHVFKGFALSAFTLGLYCFLLQKFINNPALFQAFGMENLSVYASLVFFAFLFGPIGELIGIFSNILSRKHEFEADNFARTTTSKPEEMISALKKLTVQNLGSLTPHPLKVFLSYSHPPVLERIKALRRQA